MEQQTTGVGSSWKVGDCHGGKEPHLLNSDPIVGSDAVRYESCGEE